MRKRVVPNTCICVAGSGEVHMSAACVQGVLRRVTQTTGAEFRRAHGGSGSLNAGDSPRDGKVQRHVPSCRPSQGTRMARTYTWSSETTHVITSRDFCPPPTFPNVRAVQNAPFVRVAHTFFEIGTLRTCLSNPTKENDLNLGSLLTKTLLTPIANKCQRFRSNLAQSIIIFDRRV
jgi:hypothetical protein